MSNELKEFKKHFEANCSIKVIDTIEESHLPHWKRLCFNQLNCNDMIEIAMYIKNTFSVKDTYSHLLPKIQIYNGFLCLTVDVSQIEKLIKNK
jgi:hypothetical protein